ncbi:MAG: trigger factor [Actinomycetota bacterium]
MQTSMKNAGEHRVRLTVEVPPDEFGKDLDAAYRRLAERVRVPGFRKGKAPRQIIDAQIGRDAVVGEFVETAVPTYYRAALREHDLAPIADPEFSIQDVDLERPLKFTAEVVVRPRLQLKEKEYTGLKVSRPSTEVSDEEVGRALDRLRERFAELESVERPLVDGDFAVVDLRATLHDAEVPELSRPDALYEVGSGTFVAGLDTELRGTRAGDILRFTETLDERAGERAGQTISFQVLVKDVKAKKVPVADDDFAKTASEFDTLEELRGAIREQIAESVERSADAAVRDRVLAALVERVKVDLPDLLVDDETEHRMAHARENAERAGITLERALAAQGWDVERFRTDARAHSVRALTQDLALEAVARAEDLQVSPEELGQEVANLATALGRDAKEVARSLDRSGQIVALAGDIIRSKALDVLVERAKVTPEPPGAPRPESTSE